MTEEICTIHLLTQDSIRFVNFRRLRAEIGTRKRINAGSGSSCKQRAALPGMQTNQLLLHVMIAIRDPSPY